MQLCWNLRGLVAFVLLFLNLGHRVVWADAPPPKALSSFKPLLVSETPCPDPQIFHDGMDWYIFGTAAQPFFLQGRELGPGKMRQVSVDIDYGDFKYPVLHVWGLIVEREKDGRCFGYATLHLGNFRTVIAALVPRDNARWEPGKPITRWRLAKVLIGDVARDDCSYYESKIIHEADGSRHLMYVARVGRDNHILLQRMKSPTEVDSSAAPRLLLRPSGYPSEDRNGPGSMQLVEGPSIIRLNDKYVLLYSVGDFLLNNYKLGMAFSDTLIPPAGQTYRTVKQTIPKTSREPSTTREEIIYLLQSEYPERPNYVADAVVGPGLGSVVKINGKPWLFFHGYKPDDHVRNPQNRFVFRVPLLVGIDGGEPRLDWLRAESAK
jgi:hypothetical protein